MISVNRSEFLTQMAVGAEETSGDKLGRPAGYIRSIYRDP